MAAVWMAARAQLRRRWGATVALILLVGVAGGVVLAAVAGASRTDTAMKRFVAYSNPEDVFVDVNGPTPGGVAGPPAGATDAQVQAYIAATLSDRARLVRLPQVAEAGRAPYMFMSPDKSGHELGVINPFAAADGHAFRTIDRPLALRGRLARLDRPDEAIVSDVTARLRHLRVGSRVAMWSYSAAQNADVASSGFEKIPAPEGPAYTFRIVGIVREPSDVNAPPPSVVGDAIYQGQGAMVLTPAFLQRFAADQGTDVEALPGIEGFRVRLRHGLADLPAFERELPALDVRPDDVHVGSDVTSAADKAQRAIHLETIALLLFAALAGLAAFLVVGQALARQVVADASDNPTLAALGLGRRHLLIVPLVRAGLIAVGGGVAAVVIAVCLSPLTPIGLAREAEIDPGLSVNTAVLAFGFIGVCVLCGLRALAPAWRASGTLASRRIEQAPARPGPLTAAVASSGLGPAAVAGVGMSLERGRGLAFRTALLGTLVAVAGVAAAATFGVSLGHLVDTPRQQGWNWDVVVGNPNNAQPLTGTPEAETVHAGMVDRLSTNKYVGAFSGFATSDAVSVDGRRVDLAGIETVRASVWQPIVEGRAPVSNDEIVLGRDPLRQLHRRVGQTVTLHSQGRSATMRIVGVALQPTAGDLSTRLSGGGGITIGALRRLLPETPVLQFVVRYRPGVDEHAAFASLRGDFGREILRAYPGGEVGNLGRVDFLPYVLAGLLVVLAVGALGITLLSSVRRHDRDLAILKTIGFVRRQVSATVAWQASVVAVAAVIVGIPAGVALGRWTWRVVATGVGSVSPPIVPLAAVLLVAPATLLVANLLAGAPAWAAGRVHPARVLKAE